MLQRLGFFALSLVLGWHAVVAEDRVWEIQGEFISLKAADPNFFVLRTPGGAQIEVPITALTADSRAALVELSRRQAPVKVNAVLPPAALAEDLSFCRTAAECADLCRLALAGPDLTGESRQAVESLLQEFDDRTTRNEARLGDKWVSADVAAQAGEKAAGHLDKSLEMIRLGNFKLAEQELRQASQADPSSGRADFLLGLAFMLSPRPDFDEAAGAFEKVVQREPSNGAAWNNLGVCNMQRRRYPTAVTALRSAAAVLRDQQPVVANLGLIIRVAADRRSRISENQLDEVTSLYHTLLKGRGIVAPDAATAPMVLSPDGLPLAAGGLGDLRGLVPPTGMQRPEVEITGAVVAPEMIVCGLPDGDLAVQAGLTVMAPDGRSLAARVVSRSADGSIMLVKCEGLDVQSLPLAAKSPPARAVLSLVAVPEAGAPAGHAEPLLGHGTMLTEAVAAGRPRFVYGLDAAEGAEVFRQPGTLILDEVGRVTGLAARQPNHSRSAQGRWLGIPVEVIWKLIQDFDPSIAVAEEAAEKPEADELTARCRAALVRVRQGGGNGATPR